MKLTLKRTTFTKASTIGELSVNGEFFCYTLERPWMDGKNTLNEAAILPGTYKVILTQSPHWKTQVPLLLNVPGRDNIEIHIGNFPQDIKGCICVGTEAGTDLVNHSKYAFNVMMIMFRLDSEVLQHEIEVKNA